jgi:adenylosuccinate lyase
MKQIWSQENRFQTMLEVEKTVAIVQAEVGLIPKSAAKVIEKKAKFKVEEIAKLELELKHDVIAFVQNVASYVGKDGRFVHFGLTSSDVLDTAFSLQIRQGFHVLIQEVELLEKTMEKLIENNQDAICPGRTHGMWAEPTTFAIKMAGFLAELRRNKKRLSEAASINSICKLSGAVGTYSALDPVIEKKVSQLLKLETETVATQVIPRDRHAEALWSLSMLLSGYERLAIELRHLQRSEVGEVLESFDKGQKGSSAMPHKQNPISAENITGLARMVRSYSLAAMENIALWHERDISHSAVERVFFPDAFILAHYATRRLNSLLSRLVVQKDRMRQNVESSLGLLMSSHLLLLLIEKGLSREEAYAKVQSLSFEAKKTQTHLRDLIVKDAQVMKLCTKKELDDVFSGHRHLRLQSYILEKVKKQK